MKPGEIFRCFLPSFLGLFLITLPPHAVAEPLPADINEGVTDLHRSPAGMMGDKANYIRLSQCPESAQTLVRERKLPVDQIAGCRVSLPQRVGAKTYHIVSVDYGPGQDCMAGCFFASITAAVPSDGGRSVLLPVWNKDYLVSSAFDHFPGHMYTAAHVDEFAASLNPATSRSEFLMELAEQGGHLGWRFTFKKPMEGTWLKSSEGLAKGMIGDDPCGNLSEPGNPNGCSRPGHWIKRTWRGAFFVYGKGTGAGSDGLITWDTSLVQFADTSGSPSPHRQK